MRYQQVFAVRQFQLRGLTGKGPPDFAGPITQIAFRTNNKYSGQFFMPTDIANVTISLSVTAKSPGGLSQTFADNVTSPPTSVFSGTLSLSSSGAGLNGEPNAFDTRIYLTTPFYYNPASGNLLMDVTIHPGAVVWTPAMDADLESANIVTSRLYATRAGASAGTADNKELITQFTFGNFALGNFLLTPGTSPGIGWLIFTDKVNGIAAIDTALAQHFFNHPNNLIAGKPSLNPIPAGFSLATPLANYTSFDDFRKNVIHGTIDPAYAGHVVMYDNEFWPKTPTGEQQSPKDYETQFANLAHAKGYAYMTAPSPDLTTQAPGPLRFDLYVEDGYPSFSAAALSEGYDIQAQHLETTLGGLGLGTYETFLGFTGACASAARSANPATDILIGITTTLSDGSAPTAAQLVSAVEATYNSSIYGNIPPEKDGVTVNFPLAAQALTLLEQDGF
jgi:hypothetical protein